MPRENYLKVAGIVCLLGRVGSIKQVSVFWPGQIEFVGFH